VCASQAACDSGILSSEEVTAAVQSSKNVSALLAGRMGSLLLAPVEVIAFADEEGVRCNHMHLVYWTWVATRGFLQQKALTSKRCHLSCFKCRVNLGNAVFITDTVRWRFLAYSSRAWCNARSVEGTVSCQ